MERPSVGWTPDTIHFHFTKLREADQEAIKTALAATERQFRFVVGFFSLGGTLAVIWSIFR